MMAPVNIKSLALKVWALVNASLVVLIGMELGWGEKLDQPMPVPAMRPSAPVDIAIAADFRLPEREKAYAETLERPLFVPSRRKSPPPPSLLPPTPTMQKGQFQLLGTIITDEMKIAIVKEISSGKERQIVQGYTINGLQLDLVEATRIVFTQYDDQEEIRLKIQPSPKPVSAPVTAPVTAPRSRQPAQRQAAPVNSNLPAASPGRPAEQNVSGGQIQRPAPTIRPPQTMEDRASDPLLKDFYKK